MAGLDGKEILTTGDVARICHVAPRTVSKWFDTGKLRGYRIPGSRDRRIPRKQLEAFLRANDMPLGELDGGTCRVLIVNASAQDLADALRRDGRYEVRTAGNGFQAGVVAEQFRPHVIVVDVSARPEEAEMIRRHVRSSAELAPSRLVACRDASGGELPGDYDAVIAKGYTAADLAAVIETVTDLSG